MIYGILGFVLGVGGTLATLMIMAIKEMGKWDEWED